MIDLKPCPFCGGEAALIHKAQRKVLGKDRYVYGNCVYCTVCDAEIFSSKSMAENLWNMRTGTQKERGN